jgi:hypothetical protein
MTKVLPVNSTSGDTDVAKGFGGRVTHFLSAQIIGSNLFKISLVSEISGCQLPF